MTSIRAHFSSLHADASQERLVRRVLLAAARHTGIRVETILGPGRSGNVAHTRQACMAVLRSHGFSFPEIGRVFERDHGTALHACRSIAKRLAAEPDGDTARLLAVLRAAAADDPDALYVTEMPVPR